MDVALAVVPFADIARPAIGVSLLKAGLARRGFSSRIHYFNIDFAELMGDDLYTFVSDHTPSDSMAGEWFFADLVFPGQLPSEHEFIRDIIGSVTPPDTLRRFIEARSLRAAYIERCAQTLKASGAPIVGFTTTFHQSCACLAIAKRLKEMPDPPLVCFGGANCEGEMGAEMVRSFPWIDYVCTREGDGVFPEFVERFLRQGDRRELPGFLHRESAQLTYPPMIQNMDSLPIPDYDDWVASLKASPLNSKIKRELQIEAARGCWWGAKHHCTFCGLNGDTMPYRSKSPERVYEELKYLYTRYGYNRIDSVDNILDHRYISSVFPRLVEEGIKLEMFYEVKANLKYPQLAAMFRGGIKMIQPGIESFSSEVLKLMDKGVTGIQNLQLLKWSEEIGILASWNILAGFPGESPSEYEKMAQLIPLFQHLEPPTGCSPIRLDRFSPLFNKAATAGLRRVRPTRSYYYVYPLGRRELARLAYFFDFEYEDGRNPNSYVTAVSNAVTLWRNARFQADQTLRPKLDATIQAGGAIHVADTRACAVANEHELSGVDAQVFLACDAAQSRQGLERHLASAKNRERVATVDGHNGTISSDSISDSLDRLVAARLFVHMDNQFVSLPVLRNRPPSMMETLRDAYHEIPTASNPEPLLRVL